MVCGEGEEVKVSFDVVLSVVFTNEGEEGGGSVAVVEDFSPRLAFERFRDGGRIAPRLEIPAGLLPDVLPRLDFVAAAATDDADVWMVSPDVEGVESPSESRGVPHKNVVVLSPILVCFGAKLDP
jgi:hypothetical protein